MQIQHGTPLPPTPSSPRNPGELIRLTRISLRWSQAELGRRCGYSRSQVSRWERDHPPLRDVAVLAVLAGALGLPPERFGLTAAAQTPGGSSGSRVIGVPTPSSEEAPVRRRAFLAAGLAGTSLAWSPAAHATGVIGPDPAARLENELAEVFLHRTSTTAPASLSVLRAALTEADHDFGSCRYLALAPRLAALIAACEATLAENSSSEVHAVAAKTYQLATKALIKLDPGASGLEWISADRSMREADASGDGLDRAESQRLVAAVARRAGNYERAQTLTLTSVDHLDLHQRTIPTAHLAMSGMLHCSASYAAAMAGDRDRANELLTEACAAAKRLDGAPTQQHALRANIVSHRVSAAYTLGDAGTALHHAHSIALGTIPTVERRARLLVDTARAYAQWDKPAESYRALLAAERHAPGEVHTRGAVRRLIGDLMATPRHAGMPGLRDLSFRVHAAKPRSPRS